MDKKVIIAIGMCACFAIYCVVRNSSNKHAMRKKVIVDKSSIRAEFIAAVGVEPERLFERHPHAYNSSIDFPDWFWNTIDKASSDDSKFIKLIENYSGLQLVRFAILFDVADAEIISEKHMSFLISAGVPTEYAGSDYTRGIVSKGKTFFREVCRDPQKLPTSDLHELPDFRSELTNVYFDNIDEETSLEEIVYLYFEYFEN